jgi:large subunit ribosomal protein L31
MVKQGCAQAFCLASCVPANKLEEKFANRLFKIKRLSKQSRLVVSPTFVMKADIHPKYNEAEIRCACGNVIKTRSTKPSIIVGICNVCHPFYTGQQRFVDTAGRVDKFQQRMAKTQAAQAAQAASATKKKKV